VCAVQCPSDINSMCDLAKTADLVLLMIDASFGFEMEVFEFLNILKVHGCALFSAACCCAAGY
jgi:ribosome biogenesis protein BMS1